MRISEQAMTILRSRPSMLAVALALNFSEQWIIKVIAANKDNGPLTTAKALETIRQETGLTDAEILEEEKQPQKAANL